MNQSAPDPTTAWIDLDDDERCYAKGFCPISAVNREFDPAAPKKYPRTVITADLQLHEVRTAKDYSGIGRKTCVLAAYVLGSLSVFIGWGAASSIFRTFDLFGNFFTLTSYAKPAAIILAVCISILILLSFVFAKSDLRFKLLFWNRPVIMPDPQAVKAADAKRFLPVATYTNAFALLKDKSVIFKRAYWRESTNRHHFDKVFIITERVPTPMVFFATITANDIEPEVWFYPEEWFGPDGLTVAEEFFKKNQVPVEYFTLDSKDSMRLEAAEGARVLNKLSPFTDEPLENGEDVHSFLDREQPSYPK